MLNRWIGITAGLLMLAANIALVRRDIFPALFASSPPGNEALSLPNGERRRSQIGIFDDRGARIGEGWSLAQRSGTTLNLETWTYLAGLALPNGKKSRLRVHTSFNYLESGTLYTLKMELEGDILPNTFKIEGEAVEASGDFACEWSIGELNGTFTFPLESTRALGESMRPFERLSGLFVGRSWRIKLVDPLSNMMPGWIGSRLASEPILVEVTGTETIQHFGEFVEVFRVEAKAMNAKAYVRQDGIVLRQTLAVPLLGEITVIEEPMSEAALRAARDVIFQSR